MSRRVLLLYNTPKAAKYFARLARHVVGPEIVTAALGFALKGPKLGTSDIAALIDYPMQRRAQRPHIPPWRMKLYAALYRQAAQWHSNAVWAAIEYHRPDAVGVWGGQAVDARAALETARRLGLRTYVFENGLLPDTTTCDPKGVNYDNSIPRDPAFFAALPELDPPATTLLPRASRRREAQTTLPGRYVFVPFQKWLDSQIVLYSPWIRSMEQMYAELDAAAQQSLYPADVAIVIKMHPSCSRAYRELRTHAAGSGRIVFANGNPTEQLIRGALGVVTVNSTVGIESLLFDKPVLTLGQACYQTPGIADQARNRNELADWLARLAAGTIPPAPLARRFIGFLAREYCIPGHHTRLTEAHYAAIARRLLQATL